MNGTLRLCLATNTDSDRDCGPDSDADTDNKSSTAVFMRRRVRHRLMRGCHTDAGPAMDVLTMATPTVAQNEQLEDYRAQHEKRDGHYVESYRYAPGFNQQ